VWHFILGEGFFVNQRQLIESSYLFVVVVATGQVVGVEHNERHTEVAIVQNLA